MARLRASSAMLALLALILSAIPAPQAHAAAPSQVIRNGPTSQRVIALTFDMGADNTNTAKILQILQDQGVKSTFFATGQTAERYPASLRSVLAQGHELGNHSFTHPSFPTLSPAQMRSEITRTATAIRNATGQNPRPLFRPPYGDYNATVLQAVGDAGYTHTVMWSVDTLDWTGNSAADVRNRVLRGASPGGIVLMHVGAGASGTPGALRGMISSLRAEGYSFVTVSQLLSGQSGSGGSVQYVVKAGDTVSGIAARYGTTVSAIASANRLANINLIRVGQVLTIPRTGTGPVNPVPTPAPSSTVRHTVRSGETLYAIAARYGTSVSAIAAQNNLANVNLIRVGQVLVIRTGATTPPPAPTPSQTRYTVRAGDTLYRIALRYNTTVSAITAANRISNPSLIRVGQVLVIPR